MKALEILNYIVYEDAADFKRDKTNEEVKEYIKEAIAELEALQNRSCGNCKHSRESDDGYDYFCPIQQDYFNEYMCCDKYEPKDK